VHTIVLMLLLASQGAGLPVIDGRIEASEWAGAARRAMINGGELYLLPRGEFLYLGIRGPNRGLASLCVVKGDRVRVLHASAAVGEAVYVRAGTGWTLQTGFTWALRDSPRGGGPAAGDRLAFLGRSGWLANASAAGSPEREFQIRLADVDAIAVTYLSLTEPPVVSFWPDTIDDDCRDVKVPQGYVPVTATFRPSRWHAIDRR
jgi:hypothetical protein